MNQIPLFIAIFALSTAAAAQETYKCKVGGGFVYQDRPCAGVKYAPPPAAMPAAPSPPASILPADPAKPTASEMEQKRAYLASREKDRRIGNLKDEIASEEAYLAAARQSRDAELAAIRERKSLANNNLAGANLEQALATEMQAVTARYESDIGYRQDKIKRLREDLAKAQ